ncbi:HAMP domain-containing protein, partial [Escherichia coli]|nr:HAMP domain-containing protein [Escherichia coli]
MKPMLKYAEKGMFEAIISKERGQAGGWKGARNEVLLKIFDIHPARENQLAEMAHYRARLGVIFMIGAFVLALVMTLLTFTTLRRVVILPLQRAGVRIAQIASGDLTMADEPVGRSEIGQLNGNLQKMQHALVQTVGTVRQGAEEIYRGTSEISVGNTDLSSRSEEAAAAFEQTAASLDQLTATVQQNAANADHAGKLVEADVGEA